MATSTTLITRLGVLAITSLDEHSDDLDTAAGAAVDQFCLDLGGYADGEARAALTARVLAAIRDAPRTQIDPGEHNSAGTKPATGRTDTPTGPGRPGS